MSESVTYVRIVGEPFLSRAREHRKRWLAWHAAWLEFAQSKGATGFGSTCNDLSFKDRAPPEGWTKPKGEGRFSHPKAKHSERHGRTVTNCIVGARPFPPPPGPSL